MNKKLPVANPVKIPEAEATNDGQIVLVPVDSTHKPYEDTESVELTVLNEPSRFKKLKKKIGEVFRGNKIEELTGGKCRTKKKSSRYKYRKSKKTRRKSRRKSNRRRGRR